VPADAGLNIKEENSMEIGAILGLILMGTQVFTSVKVAFNSLKSVATPESHAAAVNQAFDAGIAALGTIPGVDATKLKANIQSLHDLVLSTATLAQSTGATNEQKATMVSNVFKDALAEYASNVTGGAKTTADKFVAAESVIQEIISSVVSIAPWQPTANQTPVLDILKAEGAV
jgi:hypothetical protein